MDRTKPITLATARALAERAYIDLRRRPCRERDLALITLALVDRIRKASEELEVPL